MKMDRIIVVIPTFDRPTILKTVLGKIVNFENIDKIILAADASSMEMMRLYEKILSNYPGKVVFSLNLGRRGSTEARNAALEMSAKYIGGVKYVLLLDDDFLLPDSLVIQKLIHDLKVFPDAGAVGGKVINLRKRYVDPDFGIHVPSQLTECLTRLTGFLFGGTSSNLFYRKFTSPFLLMRASLLGKIRFDKNYEGTGYREESDFQMQILKLGFKIISDPKAFAYHLAPDTGGVRSQRDMRIRMYWKSRNHTYFIVKWNSNLLKRLWYLFCGALILSVYRPQYFKSILKGLQHGYKVAKAFEKRQSKVKL
jgi:GT2 family glycosyltransferase